MVSSGVIHIWLRGVYDVASRVPRHASDSTLSDVEHLSAAATYRQTSQSSCASSDLAMNRPYSAHASEENASESLPDSLCHGCTHPHDRNELNRVESLDFAESEVCLTGIGAANGFPYSIHKDEPSRSQWQRRAPISHGTLHTSFGSAWTASPLRDIDPKFSHHPAAGSSRRGFAGGRVAKAKGRPKGRSAEALNTAVLSQVLDAMPGLSNSDHLEEFPDFFFWFDNVKYAVYRFRCSLGKRHYDFFNRSLVHHYRAGHFHDEFGNEEGALAAFWRAYDATPDVPDTDRPDYRQLHYKVKLQALWCVPINKDPIYCQDVGSHALDKPALIYPAPDVSSRPAASCRAYSSTTTEPLKATTPSVQTGSYSDGLALRQTNSSSTLVETASSPTGDGPAQPDTSAQVLATLLSEVRALRQNQEKDRKEIRALRDTVERHRDQTQVLSNNQSWPDENDSMFETETHYSAYPNSDLIDQNGMDFQILPPSKRNQLRQPEMYTSNLVEEDNSDAISSANNLLTKKTPAAKPDKAKQWLDPRLRDSSAAFI